MDNSSWNPIESRSRDREKITEAEKPKQKQNLVYIRTSAQYFLLCFQAISLTKRNKINNTHQENQQNVLMIKFLASKFAWWNVKFRLIGEYTLLCLIHFTYLFRWKVVVVVVVVVVICSRRVVIARYPYLSISHSSHSLPFIRIRIYVSLIWLN